MAENPIAGVSGPGKFAKRTDVGTPEMKMGSIAYGEGVDTAAINSGAPKATTPGVQAQSLSSMGLAPSQQEASVGLYDKTQRPDEPITSGIDLGAGAGTSAMGMNRSVERLSDALVKMLPFDETGEIGILYQEALARGQ